MGRPPFDPTQEVGEPDRSVLLRRVSPTLLAVAPGWTELRERSLADEPAGPALLLPDWLDRTVLTADRPAVQAAIRSAIAALTGPDGLRVTFRAPSPHPPYAWMQLSAAPTSPAELTSGWTGCLVDVTATVREAEDRRRRADAEALSRTRNTLVAVRAILRLDVAPGLSAPDLALLIDGRVGALARVLTSFGPEASGERELDLVLRDELVAAVVRDEVVRIEGPSVELPFRAAQIMALAFHDLILSSLTEGALGDANGSLAVTWRVEGMPGASGASQGPVASEVLVLDWAEQAPAGPTPAATSVATPATRDAPHLDLVRQMLAYGGGGTIDVEGGSGRLACRIRLPLPTGPGPEPTG